MSIGVWQVVIILVIVVIIFGAGKLPHVMGDVAKGIKNFKKGLMDDEPKTKKNISESEAVQADVGPKAEKAEAENKQS
ncbi:MAG: twin-arginine translocase TatA/TatE family subunit [Alphaproteobacteria bacterium]|nr:twin-arginine translocase TatA/TatE family subunit [Pseudomonadota bacterium]TDI66262.1 MAG: twin-arginine translocase TatA/TatE family subunit [Alphaproteobacteria bacterium]